MVMRKRHHPHAMNNTMNPGRRQHNNQKYGNNNNYQQRPRKNYAALKEKYTNQAKEAMASGDRVLAEYYFQHADHYYRMQQEFYESRNRWREQQAASGNFVNEAEDAESDAEAESAESAEPDIDIPNNSNVLPAFLTRKVEVPAGDKVVAIQDWEE